MDIRKIDTDNKRDARRFAQFSNQLYRHCPQWVPLPLSDGLAQLNRGNAYFLHSEADFFVAEQGEQIVGRICVMENRRYNDFHQTQDAFFYLFDVIEDLEVASGLFTAAIDWGRARGLNRLVGPKGFVPFDGVGMLYKGFEYRPAMGIPYNHPYYNHFMTQLGFGKEIDFASFYLNRSEFKMPERVARIAERVKNRHNLRVKNFSSRLELYRSVPALVETYNKAFVDNWEYVPVTPEEANELAKRMVSIIQPKYTKLVLNSEDEIVGFLFTFLDISEALQKTGGKFFPFGWLRLLIGLKRTRMLNINGMGFLAEYRGLGGNAILYNELDKTIQTSHRFKHVELVQMADTVEHMLADVMTLGAKPYKRHRVYSQSI